MKQGDLKYVSKFEDQYYKMITSDKLLSGHIFTVDYLNPTTIIMVQIRPETSPPHVQKLDTQGHLWVEALLILFGIVLK